MINIALIKVLSCLIHMHAHTDTRTHTHIAAGHSSPFPWALTCTSAARPEHGTSAPPEAIPATTPVRATAALCAARYQTGPVVFYRRGASRPGQDRGGDAFKGGVLPKYDEVERDHASTAAVFPGKPWKR